MVMKHEKESDLLKIKAIVKKDDQTWQDCIQMPFSLLDPESIFYITFTLFKDDKQYGSGTAGNPADLCSKLIAKVIDAHQVYLVITTKHNVSNKWLISES